MNCCEEAYNRDDLSFPFTSAGHSCACAVSESGMFAQNAYVVVSVGHGVLQGGQLCDGPMRNAYNGDDLSDLNILHIYIPK